MKLPALLQGLRCRLCWTVTLAVFAGILAIEAAILVPSYINYERDRLEAIEMAGRYAVTTALGANGGEPNGAVIEALLNRSDVRGLRIEHNGQLIEAVGESPATALDVSDSLRERRRAGDPDRMWVTWGPDELGLPLTVSASLSTTAIPGALRDFVLRISGLVLMIAVFVTIVTMTVLQYMVLHPVIKLRDRMQAAGNHPDSPLRFMLGSRRHDELGDASRAFDRMLQLIHANLRKITERENRYRQLNRELDRRVEARTRALRAANATLEYRACHDELTGLSNRTHFTRHLQEALGECRAGQTVAVVMIGLDGFGSINGVYGYQVGDCVLQTIAGRLQQEVDESALVARFGGDVFAILLRGGSPDACASPHRTGKHCRTAIRAPIDIDARSLHCSASVGFTVIENPETDAEQAIGQADLALIAAKGTPDQPIRSFEVSMNARMERRLQLSAELRKAVEDDDLALHYQPQWTTGREIIGVEALVRWHRPGEGDISPAEFIPLAEETGVIRPLGSWVLNAAVAQAAQWHASGMNLRMAINISAIQLRAPDLVEEIRRLLSRHRLPPGKLELEVTETAMLEDIDASADTLGRLAAMGIHLAIDDFGTGHSSLAYLGQLPVHRIKIDRAFVRGLPDGQRDSTLCAAILGLSRQLGLEVVAEGVETRQQADWLDRHGCNVLQGYLLGRPLPAERLPLPPATA